jgi:methylated-DNA-[protein]-cysteine S-methyltransferase
MALVQQSSQPRKTGKPKIIVRQLTIAHASPADALQAVDPTWRFHAQIQDEPNSLVKRLQAYAKGEAVEFDDVEVALDRASAFRRRVLAACRAIPRGETRSYGELALAAGAPRAARAVGTTMASNRVSIIVPCHRVVCSGGKLGGYSARTGPTLKSRLLELEKPRHRRAPS